MVDRVAFMGRQDTLNPEHQAVLIAFDDLDLDAWSVQRAGSVGQSFMDLTTFAVVPDLSGAANVATTVRQTFSRCHE